MSLSSNQSSRRTCPRIQAQSYMPCSRVSLTLHTHWELEPDDQLQGLPSAIISATNLHTVSVWSGLDLSRSKDCRTRLISRKILSPLSRCLEYFHTHRTG